MAAAAPNAVVIVASRDTRLAGILESSGFTVFQSISGAEVLQLAAEARPDVIILDPLLIEEMSDSDLCRRLSTDPAVARSVPVLLLHDGTPTPELRVAAVRVRAWDFVSASEDRATLLLKLATYVAAKRSMGDVVENGLADAATGLRTLPGLARRAREVAALMSRVHGPLACVVIAVDGRPPMNDLGAVVARAARLSDVVGDLGTGRMGVLAPGTDAAGAVRMAVRFSDVIRLAAASRGMASGPAAGVTVVVGFDVISNVHYHPVDPFDLLQNAAAAVRTGEPVASHPWIRRYSDATSERRSGPTTVAGVTPPASPAGGVPT